MSLNYICAIFLQTYTESPEVFVHRPAVMCRNVTRSSVFDFKNKRAHKEKSLIEDNH